MKRILSILRGNGKTRKYETYEIEIDDRLSLLDALEKLRTGSVPSLVYRHSCHHGSCGTCTVRVNGREVLACITPISSLYQEGDEKIPRIDPLAVMNSLTDLAVNPAVLFNAQPENTSGLRESEWRNGEPVKNLPSQESAFSNTGDKGDKPVRFEDCIECGACISACPVLRSGTEQARGTSDFMGPAALTALNREYLKEQEKKESILERVQKPDGVPACKRYIECSRVCPRAVYPAKHIEMLRQELQKKFSRMMQGE